MDILGFLLWEYSLEVHKVLLLTSLHRYSLHAKIGLEMLERLKLLQIMKPDHFGAINPALLG